jgi:hypothetical protein
MPAEGQIRGGQLDWHGPPAHVLSESHFLAFAVDAKSEGTARSPAQIEILFRRNALRIFSLFGYLQVPYPTGYVIAFNQPELEAAWGAWQPWLIAGSTILLLATFLLMWAALATLYFFPIWFAGFFTNRDLTLAGSWRLAGAALMPGALFLSGTIVAYGLGQLDLVRLLLAGIAHFLIGWVYLIGAVNKSPLTAVASAEKQNPFSPKK